MKLLLSTYLLLLSATFSIAQSQEPLWRKGGSFNLQGFYNKNIAVYNNIGLHYNGSMLYVAWAGSRIIEYYDSTTLVRSFDTLNVNGSISEASPHCKIIILHHADSLKLYDVKKKSVLFSREGKPKVLAFSNDSRFILFDDGSIIDWNDTLKQEPIKIHVKLNNIDTTCKAEWSNDGKILIWGYQDSIRIYDAIQNVNTYIPYKNLFQGTFHFSTTGKKILNYGGYAYTVFTVEKGIPEIISKDKNMMIGDDYRFLNDNQLLCINKSTKESFFSILNLTSNTIEDTIITPSSYFADLPRFLNYDTNIVKGSIPLLSYESLYFGSTPPYTKGILHYIRLNHKPTVQTIPYRTTNCISGVCFMKGDTTVATLMCDPSIIVITRVKDGKVTNVWDIPKYVYTEKTLLPPYWVNTQLLTSDESLIFPSGNMIYKFSVHYGKIYDSIQVGNSPISFITHSVDKKHILAVYDSTIHVYNSDNLSLVKSFVHNKKILSVSLNKDTMFCTHYYDAEVKKLKFPDGSITSRQTVKDMHPFLSLDGQTVVPSQSYAAIRTHAPYELFHDETLFEPPWISGMKRVINVGELWALEQFVPELMGIPKSSSVYMLLVRNDSLVTLRKFKNLMSALTDNFIVSEDGRYCISFNVGGSMELHEINSLPVSVHDNEQETITENEQGYSVTEDYMYIHDNEIHTACTLYSITGENMGTCMITNNDGITRITIPHAIQNGFYNMVLHSNKGVISKRIVLNR